MASSYSTYNLQQIGRCLTGQICRWSQQEGDTIWQGKRAALRESLRTSWNLSFQRFTKNRQEKDWLIYIDWSVGIRRPWRRTLEEADTDTLLWRWRRRSTGNIQDSRLCRRTTQSTTHKAWGTPKNKRSELKKFRQTKRYFANTPLWTES